MEFHRGSPGATNQSILDDQAPTANDDNKMQQTVQYNEPVCDLESSIVNKHRLNL